MGSKKTKASQPNDAADERVRVGRWQDSARPIRRSFPGPRASGVPLRVAVERPAYAEIVAHAKQSLDAEICGVLAGSVCEDDEGPFVHVEAAVRGQGAKEGSAHVTYTHETWSAVHAVIERDYPKLSIVGWYHSHPGFGVEFSDMDRFIQQNFFSGPCQIGLVTDPLGGDVAVCFNAPEGTQYLDRFWVEGREQQCRVPRQPASGAPPEAALSASVEVRLAQLVQAVDDLRNSLYRWLTILGMAAALLVALVMARQVYLIAFGDSPEIPKNVTFANVPVMLEGKPCLLGVRVVQWQIPAELIAVPPELLENAEPENGQDAEHGSQPADDRSGGHQDQSRGSARQPR